MDFGFTLAEERFRDEFRKFLRNELPIDWSEARRSDVSDETWPVSRHFARQLGKAGYLGLAWPKEFGGGGRSQVIQLIFEEEIAYHRAPRDSYWIGINRAGPTIMVYGTEEQKREHLCGIIEGDITWCQGFTEPGAGSDLASLQTRAVQDGDYFVINGQKVWTSYAHYSEWCILLARTNPNVSKHKGISFFLLDMSTPGVTVSPIPDMSGEIDANRLFLDNVRIHKRHVLGAVDEGWQVATTTLNFERTGIHHSAEARRILEELLEYAQVTKRDGQRLYDNPLVRHRLAEMAVEVDAARLLSYRLAWMLDNGIVPSKEASMSKVFGTEMKRRLANVGMQLLGDHGALRRGSKWVPLRGNLQRMYVYGVAEPISVGSSEIQRNILAIRGLGLPR